MSDPLETMHLIADRAQTIARNRDFETTPRVIKRDGSPVSETDLEIEMAALDAIRAYHPRDSVLSEERGLIEGRSSRLWVLDPLDGTANYLSGGTAWGPQVALIENGMVQASLVSRPTSGRRWWARGGSGAFRSEPDGSTVRLHVSSRGSQKDLRASGLVEPGCQAAEVLREHATWVSPSEYTMGDVAAGALDCAIDDSGLIWDQAPSVLLVLEAGGCATTPMGETAADPGWGCYSNGVAHTWLLELLRPLELEERN